MFCRKENELGNNKSVNTLSVIISSIKPNQNQSKQNGTTHSDMFRYHVCVLGDMDWTLEKINEEPSTFLIPLEMELLPINIANRQWKKLKERIQSGETVHGSWLNFEKGKLKAK